MLIHSIFAEYYGNVQEVECAKSDEGWGTEGETKCDICSIIDPLGNVKTSSDLTLTPAGCLRIIDDRIQDNTLPLAELPSMQKILPSVRYY